MSEASTVDALSRKCIEVHGAVQGVGFRPHVYRLADELELKGWVVNDARGVLIEVEGENEGLRVFEDRLVSEAPPSSKIGKLRIRSIATRGDVSFEIHESHASGGKSVLMLPDLAICPDCLREIREEGNPRYRYPFINCTNCGPRFSIIEGLPYDRPQTSMSEFEMCPFCREEYSDPGNRRFHAQPIACPNCGPKISFHDHLGKKIDDEEEALMEAVSAIRNGEIIALKGLGGYQLVADSFNEEAVAKLRIRKGRGAKPFAVMCPDEDWALRLCCVSAQERNLLNSVVAPIVLMKKRDQLLDHVAPAIAELGIMLPYTPLHHLLMSELGRPIIATSANRSEEPICTGNEEAVYRLAGIADGYLMHNRRIVRHVDDSVARVVCGQEQILRRARGYAPFPIMVPKTLIAPTIAVGAHMKNSVALGVGNKLFASQHIGDLDTEESLSAFLKTASDLPMLYEKEPATVVHDSHPDYASTRFAQSTDKEKVAVQHHLAHVYACMGDCGLEAPVMGFSWDGVGYGEGGEVWGGEGFLVDDTGASRVASIWPFRLIGGDAAAKEPRRAALGLLLELAGLVPDCLEDLQLGRAFERSELRTFSKMAKSGLNSPLTTSMGRLFDGVSSLLGLCHRNEFEGQAAMLLEGIADSTNELRSASFEIVKNETGGLLLLDWRPLVRGVIEDLHGGVGVSSIARGFHLALARAVVSMAQQFDPKDIVLTGGCFQNRLLTELTVTSLIEAKLVPHIHRNVPPNDGGIAIGQLYSQCV